MMIGLPASGKSTEAEKISKWDNAVIHSSDRIRVELSGDINNQIINEKTFQELHKRVKRDLIAKKNVIYDATNISYKRRKGFLSELKNINCEKIAVLMATPYETCLSNNMKRDRKVPVDIIKKMYINFNIPYWYEGWNGIRPVYNVTKQMSPESLMDKYMDFNQHNEHHSLTLGEHLKKTREYIRLISDDIIISPELMTAALLHDCGKPFTKCFVDHHGKLSEEAHYYNHQNCGAYDSLFYNTKLSYKSSLHHAVIIQWHMQPYFWEKDQINGENQRLKYFNLWGEKLYNDIMVLHIADKLAH